MSEPSKAAVELADALYRNALVFDNWEFETAEKYIQAALDTTHNEALVMARDASVDVLGLSQSGQQTYDSITALMRKP